ncbi:MAG: PIN domain-containing protein [Actinomycetota bacterium]
MGALIDSSGIIAAEKGEASISKSLFPNEPVAIAAPTASELLEIVERTEDSALAAQRAAFVERLLEHVDVVPFDGPAARIRARLDAEVAGEPAAADSRALDVAAIALSRGWFVVTRNGRYDAINGLKILRI